MHSCCRLFYGIKGYYEKVKGYGCFFDRAKVGEDMEVLQAYLPPVKFWNAYL